MTHPYTYTNRSEVLRYLWNKLSALEASLFLSFACAAQGIKITNNWQKN
jgi:hypothetical protein